MYALSSYYAYYPIEYRALNLSALTIAIALIADYSFILTSSDESKKAQRWISGGFYSILSVVVGILSIYSIIHENERGYGYIYSDSYYSLLKGILAVSIVIQLVQTIWFIIIKTDLKLILTSFITCICTGLFTYYFFQSNDIWEILPFITISISLTISLLIFIFSLLLSENKIKSFLISPIIIAILSLCMPITITGYNIHKQNNIKTQKAEQKRLQQIEDEERQAKEAYNALRIKWKDFSGTTYRASHFTSEGYQYYAFSYNSAGKGKYIIWWDYTGTNVVEEKMEFSIYKVESDANYLYLYTNELNTPVKIKIEGSSLYTNDGNERYEIWHSRH